MSPSANGSASHKVNSAKAAAQSKKKRKAYKKKGKESDEYVENRKKAAQLQERFSGKKKSEKKEEDNGVYFQFKNNQMKVTNGESHNNLIARALENQVSRLYQIDVRAEVVATQWKCCLCQERSARGELGDLFGPYYVTPTLNWPTFLCKKPKAVDGVEIDVWMHGDCALWAPNVHMCGNRLTNLDKQLNQFWGQNCSICGKAGASIPIGGNKHFVHFPCASKKGYKMDETFLTCEAV